MKLIFVFLIIYAFFFVYISMGTDGERQAENCVEFAGFSTDIHKNLNGCKAKVICSTNATYFDRNRSPWYSARMDKVESQFSISERQAFINMHNAYRGSAGPKAADMRFMEWHDEAAMLAQLWADSCVFEHGFAQNHPLSDQLGQNLYMGSRKHAFEVTRLWFQEYHDYDMKNLKCRENKTCGHYTQLMWADSNSLGCGIKECDYNNGKVHIIVCNYYPRGNQIGVAPYKIGPTCSMCSAGQNDSCYKNLCASKELCDRSKLSCTPINFRINKITKISGSSRIMPGIFLIFFANLCKV